ncbi:MAG TPA: hypothetical protein VMT62_03745 [Syntrophorhabdaceae bacterium]|nr:hypothetical protein [Syntrophorhabdaceae bacterium]
MKKTCRLAGLTSVLVFALAPLSTGFCQADRCIVLETKDSTALVSCGDGTTRITDVSGRSQQYKAGDSISLPRTDVPGGRETERSRGSGPSSSDVPAARTR